MAFTRFNNTVTKPTFGQPYLNASGYDDRHEELCQREEPNLNFLTVEKNVRVTVAVMDHFTNYDGLCKVLGIKSAELLKHIANEKGHIEDILKFIYNHRGKHSLICNLNIVTEEATLQYHCRAKAVTRSVEKLLLGHNVILCIPLEKRICSEIEVTNYINSLIAKHDNGNIPEYFLCKAAALIDYKKVIKKPAFEILNELHDYQFSKEFISLFVELPEKQTTYFSFFEPRSLNYVNERELVLFLTLKKLLYLMETKFDYIRKTNHEKTILRYSEREMVIQEIIRDVEKLKDDMDFSIFPLPEFFTLYQHCSVFENQCISALYHETELPQMFLPLVKHLDAAYKFLKNLPLKKIKYGWEIKVNDKNAKEIREKFLINKMYILFTPITKPQTVELLKENILWVFSEEEKWKNSTEPVLILNGSVEILLGMCTPQMNVTYKNCNSTTKNGNIFYDSCNCNVGDRKAWICIKCKNFVRNEFMFSVFCKCGVQRQINLIKKCFKCDIPNSLKANIEADKCELHKQNDNIPLKQDAKNDAQLEKKPLNVLFIGQSGAGKSMLINSIYNYLKYSFDEIIDAESVECILPCEFPFQTPDFRRLVIKAGPKNENEKFNENGECVTKKPKAYQFYCKRRNIKFIDTPGLGDTRGAKQDEHNLNLIRNTIIQIEELHSICFVMPSNMSKLKANFEAHMRELLFMFPKTALKNVFFFFTYANSTFFTIGDTRNILEKFIASFKDSNNVEIPFCPANVYCVDSEAFMYFIATKQGHKYQNRDQESFRISWHKSKEAIEKFLTQIEDVEPIKSNDILMTYELEQIGTFLQKEDNPKIAQLIIVILTKISQISMTSKFISEKKTNIQTMGEFNKQALFEALALCQNHVEDANLKQFINKLITAYGDKSASEIHETTTPNYDIIKEFDQEDTILIKTGSYTTKKQTENKKQIETSAPLPAPTSQNKLAENMKEIADKIGEEWEKGGIKKTAMETVLNIQIAANKRFKDIDHQKIKLSLEILLMDLKGDLEAEISALLEKYYLLDHRLPSFPVEEEEKIEHQVSLNSNVHLIEVINSFAKKFKSFMRQGKLPRTLCEEFVSFQMAEKCKAEELQIEQLLDALTSTEITLLPGNEFIRDIHNLRMLLEEEQIKKMPKIKNIEVKVGENIVLYYKMQENENLHKILSLRKESNETLLEITANSTDIADFFLPESKTVILNFNICWEETGSIDILPLYNAITICPNKVFTYIPFTDDSSIFPSSIDYKDPNPIIGVDYDSPTVIKEVITTLGLKEIPKNASTKMAVCALRGFPELIYFIQTNQSTHFVNPETVMAELLKEATKNIEKSDILLTIPRCFDNTRKSAYTKAAEYANLTNIKFVDEITALAYGFETKMDENKIYLLIHYFYPNFTVSLFKSGVFKDKEISTELIEFEDFKEWENMFFDSIINENEENNCRNLNKITRLLEKMSLNELKPDSIIVAFKSSLLSKIFADYFPNTEITTINDPESYISEGANLAFHTSLLP